MDGFYCPPGVCCMEYEFFKKERGFILDCVAVSNTAKEYGKVQPKRCDVIPPYNAQTDPFAKHYFQSKEMRTLLKRTDQVSSGLLQQSSSWAQCPPWRQADKPDGQPQLTVHSASTPPTRAVEVFDEKYRDHGGTSNSGWLVDYFYKHGPAQKYMARRNAYGAAHSHDEIVGHRGYLSDLKPINGYNGRFGFRRNVPSLRQKPSNFGEVTDLTLY
uniref:sperm microtubule associated protein 1-like n=1 Tax=Pristiophorus japonicus TaxID=55135 RepID=UPI00398F6717